MNEKEACLILKSVCSLSPLKLWNLVKSLGSACAVLHASASLLEKTALLSSASLQKILSWEKNPIWKKELKTCESESLSLITYDSSDYPKLLSKIEDPPILLFAKGHTELLSKEGLAIVGTREPSPYGRQAVESICSEISLSKLVIFSGLAKGVDQLAHEVALSKNKDTVAIVPCGLSSILENKLARRLQRHGCLVSEYPPSLPVQKHQCIERNRIISGLARGTLIIQGDCESGAMHTLRFSKKQKRHCFALPGPITDTKFRGNHQLIKEGNARLIDNAADILSAFDGLFSLTEYPMTPEKWESNDKLTPSPT